MKQFSALIGIALLAALASFGCSSKSSEKAASGMAPVRVTVAPLATHHFRHEILVQGTLQAVDRADLSSRIAGTIDDLQVREGARVKHDDVLFSVDRQNLENQLKVTEETLKVQKSSCAVSEANVAIAQTNLEKAALDHDRYEKLAQKDVISESDRESYEVAWKNAVQALEQAKATLACSQAQVSQAQTNVDIARKNLSDSITKAPYDGVITARAKDAGEYANVGAAVLSIEDPSRLEISCRISALYYSDISLDTKLEIRFAGRKVADAHPYYRSPSVDPTTRTFEIKAYLPKDCPVVSGTLCDLSIILAERDGLGIAENAVLPRKGGSYIVFVTDGQKAKQVEVKPGFTTDHVTELLDCDALKDQQLITVGQYFLNDGSPIQIETADK